jgi:hypothetical protein
MNICARKRPGFYAPGKVRKTASFAIIPARIPPEKCRKTGIKKDASGRYSKNFLFAPKKVSKYAENDV